MMLWKMFSCLWPYHEVTIVVSFKYLQELSDSRAVKITRHYCYYCYGMSKMNKNLKIKRNVMFFYEDKLMLNYKFE